MAGEIIGFPGYGASGEGNNAWGVEGNLARKLDEADVEGNDENSAEIVDFEAEKTKKAEIRQLQEQIAQKESLLSSIERTIPNEAMRALRKRELAKGIEEARERLQKLGDKALSTIEKVDGENITDEEFAVAKAGSGVDNGEPIDVEAKVVEERPLTEKELADLEAEKILDGGDLAVEYETVVQEFGKLGQEVAALEKMPQRNENLITTQISRLDTLRHQKEILEQYADKNNIKLPGMSEGAQSTDMAQYANGELKGLSEDEEQAILAEFDSRKVENADPSAETLAKVNRAKVERTASEVGMPELLELYDQRIAERAAAGVDEMGSSYVATRGDMEDSAGEDMGSGVVSEVASEADLADDDVYNSEKQRLMGELEAIAGGDGNMELYAQTGEPTTLMKILRNRAQQELGIKGEDIMDDRQRKVGEKFTPEDEAKIDEWANNKLAKVERYREVKQELEGLEEKRAEALKKAGRDGETGGSKFESKTGANDEFFAEFGRAADPRKWLRRGMDPAGTMSEEKFDERYEQTLTQYEAWHNALADGVFNQIQEQKEKGLKGAWSAIKRFANKQFRKVAGGLAGLAVFGAATAATNFNVEAAGSAGALESLDLESEDENQQAGWDLTGTMERTASLGALDERAKFNTGSNYEVSANGVKSDYTSNYLDFEHKLRHNNYGVDKSYLYEDVDGSIKEIVSMMMAQPEQLASYVAMCDQSVWEDCGINLQKSGDLLRDGAELDKVISTNGEIQGKAIEVLTKLLTNDQSRASATFNEEYDREITSYMYTMEDDTGLFTPESIYLGYTEIQRNGEKQFNIDLYREDGTKVGSLDLNMDCGFQTNLELPDTAEFVEYNTPETQTTVLNEIPVEVERNIEEAPAGGTDINTDKNETPEGEQPGGGTTPGGGGEDENEQPGGGTTPEGGGEDKNEQPGGGGGDNGEEDNGSEDNGGGGEANGGGGNEDNNDGDENNGDDNGEDGENGSGEEKVIVKDAENEKKVVEEGGQTNPVGQTSSDVFNNASGTIVEPSNQTDDNAIAQGDITGNLTGTYDVTSEDSAIPSEGAQVSVEAGAVADYTASAEDQSSNEAAQDTANANELTENMALDERAAWAERLTNLAQQGRQAINEAGSQTQGMAENQTFTQEQVDRIVQQQIENAYSPNGGDQGQ